MRLFGKKTGRTEVDMTQGGIFSHLAKFSLPLLFGNFFQLLYNMVDSWVVGNFVSNEAFSAVGTVGPVIWTLIGLFMGLGSGAGVVISQYFGAGRTDKVQSAVHTALLGTVLLGMCFTVAGLLITPGMLRLMNVPAEVQPEAAAYLRIYFLGITGLMIYNIGTSILQAVGNSRLPLVFLIVCTVLNAGLDLFFVLFFKMGVEGVAYATILSEAISAALVLIVLMRTDSSVKLRLRLLQLDGGMLMRILRIGLPTGVQFAVTSFSNAFVQSYINFFGADAMSGWTAYSKLDELLSLPMKSISLGVSTFVGQNLGREQAERAKDGTVTGLWMALGSVFILAVPVMLLAPRCVAFFNPKPEVVAFGTRYLRLLSPFYLLLAVNNIIAGALRGAGNTRIPVIITLSSYVLFRQIYLYVMAHYISNTAMCIGFSYPAGWALACVLLLLYYRRQGLGKTDLIS